MKWRTNDAKVGLIWRTHQLRKRVSSHLDGTLNWPIGNQSFLLFSSLHHPYSCQQHTIGLKSSPALPSSTTLIWGAKETDPKKKTNNLGNVSRRTINFMPSLNPDPKTGHNNKIFFMCYVGPCRFTPFSILLNSPLMVIFMLIYSIYAEDTPVPVAARSKPWVCGRSPAEIVGSKHTGGQDVCLLWVLCVVR